MTMHSCPFDDDVVYLYHAESDFLFTMPKDEYREFASSGDIDAELCIQLSKEEYEQKKQILGL